MKKKHKRINYKIGNGCKRCGRDFTQDMREAVAARPHWPEWLVLQYHPKCVPPDVLKRLGLGHLPAS